MSSSSAKAQPIEPGLETNVGIECLDDSTVIVVRAPDVVSVTTLEARFNDLDAVIGNWSGIGLVVDLSRVRSLDAAQRVCLRERLCLLASRVRHVSVVAPNLMIRVAARFVFADFGLPAFTIHDSPVEALEVARRAAV